MSSVALYSYWRSSASWRVRIALELKGIKYEYKAVNLVANEQNTDQFSEVNPNNTIPVLEWDGKKISQSLAILEFLEEMSPSVKLLPTDPFKRAQVRSIVNLIVCDIHPIQNLRVLKKVEVLSSQSQAKSDWARFWITRGFTALEKILSNGVAGKYCVGDEITLADASLVPQYFNAVSPPKKRFDVDLRAFPTINRIHAALSEVDAFKRAHASVQPDAST
ncbi:hypothetical protein HDU97_003101 [Phlyctochytrium planicorne]|nr:hypothetical protein HDU97_003053 [Phlyctochytrium planicorne]KAJ3109673.1 hypothetical protein HDU97_003101 [Phlyctochytrium planicorne]